MNCTYVWQVAVLTLPEYNKLLAIKRFVCKFTKFYPFVTLKAKKNQ